MGGLIVVSMIGAGFIIFLVMSMPVLFLVYWLIKQVVIYFKYRYKKEQETL